MSHLKFFVVLLVLLVEGQGQMMPACVLPCKTTFDSALHMASQAASPGLMAEQTCTAMATFSSCVRNEMINCSGQALEAVRYMLPRMEANYNITCGDGQAGVKAEAAAQCGSKAMECMRSFNATFLPAVGQGDVQATCRAVEAYSECLDIMMATSQCGLYVRNTLQNLYLLKAEYAPICQGGDNAIGCANRTFDCYTAFNSSFYPALNTYNTSLMCSSVDAYTKCIGSLASDPKCQSYVGPAMTSVQRMYQQHSLVCGSDNGESTKACIEQFKQCYAHVNTTLRPQTQTPDHAQFCNSLEEYARCATAVPKRCSTILGPYMTNVGIMVGSFRPYCSSDFQEVLQCKPLAQCSQHLMVNVTVPDFNSATACLAVSRFFPCVISALRGCNLPDHKATKQFQQLSELSQQYCTSVINTPDARACLGVTNCHRPIGDAGSTPFRMYDAGVWCQFLQRSMGCTAEVMRSARCTGLSPNNAQLRASLNSVMDQSLSVCQPGQVKQDRTNTVDSNSGAQNQSPENGASSSSDLLLFVSLHLPILAALLLV